MRQLRLRGRREPRGPGPGLDHVRGRRPDPSGPAARSVDGRDRRRGRLPGGEAIGCASRSPRTVRGDRRDGPPHLVDREGREPRTRRVQPREPRGGLRASVRIAARPGSAGRGAGLDARRPGEGFKSPLGELARRDRRGRPVPRLGGARRAVDAGPDRPADRRERGYHPKTLSPTEGIPGREGDAIGGGLIAGICPTCGLPKEICVCEDLGRETTQLSVEMDTRRYGKAVTVVRGLESKPDEAEKLARDLKKGLATGGSGKGGVIVLQGDHRKDVVRLLQSKGYNVR